MREDEEADWMKVYHDFLRSTAADLAHSSTRAPLVKVLRLEQPFAAPSTDFPWLLDAKQGFRVETAYGFKVTAEGLIKPLDSNDGTVTHFKVPPCEKDDTLVAFILLTKDERDSQSSLGDVFQSYAP